MGCQLWRCKKQDKNETCEELGVECIGDMCECYNQCKECSKHGSEDCPQY